MVVLMIIHVVQSGETIYSIAENYDVSAIRLMQENGIDSPDNLVPGQTIVILYPEQTYIVKEGDTLLGIAEAHGVSVIQLLRNNPYLSNRESIYPGETIVINYQGEKIMTISINGYAYPFINRSILKETLPYLTYLTVFNYNITPTGELIDIPDEEIIQIAKDFGVAPIMLVTTLTEQGTFSSEIARNILQNEDLQDHLIDNILSVLKEKGYYGVNLDFQHILPEDQHLFVDFITKAGARLHEEGFHLIITLTPVTLETENGLFYTDFDYTSIAQAADQIMLLSYQWGYFFGPPATTITPFNTVISNLEYSITLIPPDKTNIGIPIIAYDWQLPYMENISRAYSLSYCSAISLAAQTGSTIMYDETYQAAYFSYIEEGPSEKTEHIVWFKDARSIDVLLSLIPQYGLKGIGVWNILCEFPQMWLVINSQYDIAQVL